MGEIEKTRRCKHCKGEYMSIDAASRRCGECASFYTQAKLAETILHAGKGRGDNAAANAVMGYPQFEHEMMTYLVREQGASIPALTLCGAHDALWVYDAIGGDGLSADEAEAHYATQLPEGRCDTCREFAR